MMGKGVDEDDSGMLAQESSPGDGPYASVECSR